MSQSADVKRVMDRIAQVTEGLKELDIAKISSVYAFDDLRFTAFEDHAPFKRLDGPELKKLFQTVSNASEFKDSKYDIKVDVYGDIAVATGYEDWVVKFKDGTKDSSKARFTIVFIRKASDWFVIHEQFTRM